MAELDVLEKRSAESGQGNVSIAVATFTPIDSAVNRLNVQVARQKQRVQGSIGRLGKHGVKGTEDELTGIENSLKQVEERKRVADGEAPALALQLAGAERQLSKITAELNVLKLRLTGSNVFEAIALHREIERMSDKYRVQVKLTWELRHKSSQSRQISNDSVFRLEQLRRDYEVAKKNQGRLAKIIISLRNGQSAISGMSARLSKLEHRLTQLAPCFSEGRWGHLLPCELVERLDDQGFTELVNAMCDLAHSAKESQMRLPILPVHFSGPRQRNDGVSWTSHEKDAVRLTRCRKAVIDALMKGVNSKSPNSPFAAAQDYLDTSWPKTPDKLVALLVN